MENGKGQLRKVIISGSPALLLFSEGDNRSLYIFFSLNA